MRSFWHAFLLGLLNGVLVALGVFLLALTLWGCAHRDLKPDNVLQNVAEPVSYVIDSRCESKLLVNGQCVPLDWVVAACTPRDAYCSLPCFKPRYPAACDYHYDGCHWRCAPPSLGEE